MNTNKLKRSPATLLVAGIVAMPSVVVHAEAMKAFPTPEAAMDAFGVAVIDNVEAAKQAIFGKKPPRQSFRRSAPTSAIAS